MSSKRRIRRKSCKGKQRFDTIDAAWTACRSVMRKNVKVGYATGPMNAYPCKFCGGFHFGHSPAAVLKNSRSR